MFFLELPGVVILKTATLRTAKSVSVTLSRILFCYYSSFRFSSHISNITRGESIRRPVGLIAISFVFIWLMLQSTSKLNNRNTIIYFFPHCGPVKRAGFFSATNNGEAWSLNTFCTRASKMDVIGAILPSIYNLVVTVIML